MNKFLFFTTFSIALSAGTYWFAISNNASECITTENLSSSPLDTDILFDELQQLKLDNELLKKQLAGINHKSRVEISSQENSAPTEKEEFVAQEIIFNEQYQTLKRAEDFSKYTSELETRNTSLEKDMEEKFQTESVDYEWASAYQEKLSSLFSSTSTLTEAEPDLIECKTNRCQIKIRVTDSAHANALTTAFSSALDTNTLEIQKTAVIAAPNFSQGLLNLYIAKNNQVNIYE